MTNEERSERARKAGNRTKEIQTALDKDYYKHLAEKSNAKQRAEGWKNHKRGKDKQPRKLRGRVDGKV